MQKKITTQLSEIIAGMVLAKFSMRILKFFTRKSRNWNGIKSRYVFTIEPMINLGTHKTKLSKNDGWTVETIDGRLSAQWEHTLAITDDGCEVLTARSEETL